MARPDPKLFIVWSSKYKYIAEQVYSKLLDKRKTGFPVYPIMFNIANGANVNKDMFTSLVESMNSADYALILMTPDEEVMRRENGSIMGGFYSTSRPNVYFEYGYLSKQLSTHKIFVYNTNGLMTPSDTSSLITNYMKSPTSFDEIIKLPQTIAEDLEKHFSFKKEYYIDLNQESYEINYQDVFNDITKNNEYAEFIINNNINLGKYWRHEIKRFPQDPYHIGRKIIYILERIPFNVYLYASPKSTSTIEQPEKFIDVEVFTVLKKDIDTFLKTIDDPEQYRNYKLYMTCLKMLEVIEKYQIKRNDSPAFSFSRKNTYSEETSTLIDLEEYITHFPLSQMLFNRYLALCLHKKTMSIFNFEELNFDFKKKINKYFKDEKDDDYFIAIMQISMALIYINKTIEAAEKYDSNNSIELHKSLALFDKARMEYLFHTLLQIKYEMKELPGLSLNDIRNLFNKKENIDFVKELAIEKIKKKFEKSFDYALIDFFNKVLSKQYKSSKDISCKKQFSIEVIKLISENILSIISKIISEEFNELGVEDSVNPPQTELNQRTEEYYNEVNDVWRDSPYDIVIFNKSSLCKCICCKYNEEEKVADLECEIIHIIKNGALECGINIDDEKIGIHIFNFDDAKQNLEGSIKEICKFEFYETYNNLIHDLEENIRRSERTGSKYKWEEIIDNAITIRHNMWNAAKDWPPNMRSILLFEYYHALSDKYIYKINEIKSRLELCSEELDKICREELPEILKGESEIIIKELQNNKEYALLKTMFSEDVFEKINKKDCFQSYLEYLGYLSELAEIKAKLQHATEVMESNYEIPDLSCNILKKIKEVLDSENMDNTLLLIGDGATKMVKK